MEREFLITKQPFNEPNKFGFTVADHNGKQIGYVNGQINPGDIKTADLADIFVDEKYRRQGYGSALFSSFVFEAKNRGATVVDAEVVPNRGADYDTTTYFYTSNGAFMNSINRAVVDLATVNPSAE